MSTFQDATQYTYQYVDVKNALAQALTSELLQSNFGNGTIRVFKSDPLDEVSIPAIGINLVSANEDSSGLGLTSQTPTYDSTTKLYTTYQGLYMREEVEVRIFHKNADERDKLRIFALAVLFAIRNDLLQTGLMNITLSGGRDEQDNTLLQSSPLFMHSIMMGYLNPLNVQVTTNVQTITAVPVTPTVDNGLPHK